MAHSFISTWLEKQTPYATIYASDFDQKYPMNPRNDGPYLPPATQNPYESIEYKNYYYASTYRADFSGQPTLPKTYNNQKFTKNMASLQ